MTAPLVDTPWLLEHYADDDVRIVDTRFTLGKPEQGRTVFDAGHIPGAVFVDLERDLSAPPRPDRVGGRHPIPAVEQLEAVFRRLGISSGQKVIAYDDPSTGAGFYGPHLWWLLRYLGHENVAVLDGGLPAWLAAGGALETAEQRYPVGAFQAKLRPEMVVDAAAVAERSNTAVLIDSRAPERYRGEVEPLDWKAGHIPGAINANWAEGVRDGHWKSAEEQKQRFPENGEVIVYCGSGVSAAGNLLALELAGITGVKLYAGSWSDWISDDARPIATGRLA
jgi:thiosulfate/3-mercaptopyruvate sulfurtransferase